MSSHSKLMSSITEDTDLDVTEDRLRNGTYEVETMVALHCPGDSGDGIANGHHINNDGMSEFSNSDLSLPEVCVSSHTNSFEEDMNYEVQQAYRIFTGFLLDKHKGITSPFLHPIGNQEGNCGIGGVLGWGQAQLRQSMCLRRIKEKFINQEYDSITEFVADFRLMLENCYRYHGVDHWISKQAQKLEIMLEQKLTLLSRPLREKTTLAVTSKGRFGAEEERSSGGTSTRRRLAPRSLATLTVGGHESIMVQTLRLEEQQRAKDEKRQRELEKKEAEEMSAKEVEEWEQTLLSQASPQTVDTLWELPAIGHFLCLAQTALNLPEIVFFELERCLLMPRCSLLLSKIMSSLLSQPQRRATLHRRPALPYRRWESELRQRVMGWYRAIGASHDQPGRAEQLGLSHQFFNTLGEVSPLEEKPFHLLPFYQRVWLLKGLCDNVYETQKDVQDSVLAQPIHECRESILGYDSKENAYIHFPHFCGADLRIYCQSPSPPPVFPFPSVWVKRVVTEPGTEGEESGGIKAMRGKSDIGYSGGFVDTGESDDLDKTRTEILGPFKRENGDGNLDSKRFQSWSVKKEEGSESESSDEDFCGGLKWDSNSSSLTHARPIAESGVKRSMKKESCTELQHQSKRLKLKQEQCLSLSSMRIIKAETQEPCLSVGEHSYTGRSPACSVSLASPAKPLSLKIEEACPSRGQQRSSCLECCESKATNVASEEHNFCCSTSSLATQMSSESTQNSSEERVSDKIWTKKKRWKKKRGREQLPRGKGEHKQLQHVDRMRLSPDERAMSAGPGVATIIKRRDKKKKHKTEKKIDSSKKIKDQSAVKPAFKLVCTSLEELRELISKTEDELDDLESTKKRLGRWYYRREAVKDLHSTLIRLLNELSPWEPKLLKAYQRNRLRLKKEFDDFKKHPEYNNFVREECISSSSSEDEEERCLEKEVCSLSDPYRRSEEEDMEHVVPRGLWRGASTGEFVAASPGEKTVTTDEPHNPLKQLTSSPDSGPQSQFELFPSNQFRNSNFVWAASMPAHTSLSPRPTVLHPTTGLPKGYTPIPSLLAKSVGNKVTLMKRPADCPAINNTDGQKKESLVSLPVSTVAAPKHLKAQSFQQNPQQIQAQGLQPTQVIRQSGKATVMAAPPKLTQAKPTQTAPKSPVQMVYKVPEELSHQVCKDGSSPVRVSVHPVVDRNTAEKIMQQVVILPSNLLIKKTEEKASSLHKRQSVSIQASVSDVSSPLSMSTSVPGFTIPENRIPVQQVAPLKDARTVEDSSLSISPYLQTAGVKGAQVCAHQNSTSSIAHSPINTNSRTVSAEPNNSEDPKQELKTVCVRDSQSILVTTRGGNTGIVKVQPSSDCSALGSLPNSPVITISPQLKAFLISKTSPTLSSSSPSQTTLCTDPSATMIPVAQPQMRVPSVIKSPSTVTTPIFTAVTSSMAVTGQGHVSGGNTVAASQGSSTSTSPTGAAKTGQLAQATAFGSQLKAAVQRNTVVPSLSSCVVPQAFTQAEVVSTGGGKQLSSNDRAQVTKLIFVTPSSCSTSNVAFLKGTPSLTKSLPSSRVMFISQPTPVSPPAFTGSLSNQAKLSPVGGGNSAKVKNISLSSDFGQPTVSTTIALVPAISSTTVTSYSDSWASVTTSPQLQGTPSLSAISHTDSSISTSSPATLPDGNVIRKDIGVSAGISSGSSLAQVTTTMQSSIAHSSRPALVCQPSHIQSSSGEETLSMLSLSQHSLKKPPAAISAAATTATPYATSVSGTVQQRIVLNTSTPLAAGTQIFLNSGRFAVPPQGLGPGTHVLIISSPAPQQVPAASVASTVALVHHQGAGHVTVAPQAAVLPLSPAKLPGVLTASSPLVACTTAAGPSLLASTPNVMPVRLAGPSHLGSALLPSKPNVVSAMQRLPAAQPGNLASGALSLISSLPKLDSVQVPVSPVTTSAPGPAVRLATSVPVRAECSSGISPLAASSLPVHAPLSPLPVFHIPSAVALHSLASPSSAGTPLAAGTPLHSSIPVHHVVSGTTSGPGIHPQQAPEQIAAASTSLSQALLHTGQSNTLIKTQLPAAMQPGLAGTRTHVLPTVAVPPIVSSVSKVQTLPVATVPPIESPFNTFETTPVVTASSCSSTVMITQAQPIASLKANNNIHLPEMLTNRALGKPSLQTATLGIDASVASKLLISPDGAVLSTVPCQVSPAEWTARPKPLGALLVSPDSSTGCLQTRDSSLQPSQADTK